jgi:outer membrane immunogenic protein
MNGFRTALAGAALSAVVLAAPSAFAQGPASWTGIYVGAHVGHAWTDVDWGLGYTGITANDLPGTFGFNHDGVIAGGQLGLQFQSGKWVFGTELALSGGHSASRIDDVQLFFDNAVGTLETKVDWMVLATARLGYASDKWLAYVKGGYAGAMISVSSDDNVPPDWGFQDRRLHHGWTLGGGVEYKILSGVTLGVEYNYIKLNADFSAPVVELPNGAQEGTSASSIDTESHSVTARINFLLNGN